MSDYNTKNNKEYRAIPSATTDNIGETLARIIINEFSKHYGHWNIAYIVGTFLSVAYYKFG